MQGGYLRPSGKSGQLPESIGRLTLTLCFNRSLDKIGENLWEAGAGLKKEYHKAGRVIDRLAILELLDGNSLTVHFQPIFSSNDGAVYGYEALTRIKEDKVTGGIGDLFKTAIRTNTISSLDVQCRGECR